MTQHRLARVQLINWGTFTGEWSFAVPWKGMLLTGPSGAGKSSVLDAMAAVLVAPGKLRFNAAAQGTDTRDHDRSLVTYVRGAHKREADEETGEVGAAFLRKGPTWSGIALTFVDAAGTATSLVRLFHISGSSAQREDLKSLFAVAPGEVDLLALQGFVANGIEHRQLKAAFPDWHTYPADKYGSFSERFRRLLGIGSEQAQVLLHKTQSAKNLTNLDALFRDFMLDVPGTFDLAEQMVEQFGELRSAHTTVVDARNQVDALLPLRPLAAELGDLDTRHRAVELQAVHLDAWLWGRRLTAVRDELETLQPVTARLEAEVGAAETAVKVAEEERRRCQQALDNSGGGDVSLLEKVRAGHVADRDRVIAERARVEHCAGLLGLAAPSSAADVGRFADEVAGQREALVSRREAFSVAQRERLTAKGEATGRRGRLADDLAALRRHRSNLDARLLAVRENLATVLQVQPGRLPFVGELLQVRADEARWTGAIERVLGSFARTLVIPAGYYRAAAEYIDREHLHTRLVYERVEPVDGAVQPVEADLLPGKLEVADSEYAGWVAERLERRFRYACVPDPTAFGDHDRAVTVNGQVKHSAGLHEKDDRRRVDDRSRWVLGFSTEAKEADLEERLARVNAELDGIEADLRRLDDEQADIEARSGALRGLDGVQWEDIDPAAHEESIAGVDRRLEQLRSDNRDLARLSAEYERASDAKALADRQVGDLRLARDRHAGTVAAKTTEAERLAARLADAPPVPVDVADALTREAAGLADADLDARLRDRLHRRSTELTQAIARTDRQAGRLMDAYRNDWPAAAADWAGTREYLPEFLGRLDELEADRLPEFEDRFFDLLNRQARNNISMLSSQIRNARAEIRSRVDDVNRSLLLTRFSREGMLQIKVLDRSLPVVDEFRRDLGRITETSLLDLGGAEATDERRAAEERFTHMERLLDRLGSADPGDRSWRELCLDTRQHVAFQASVVDDDGVQVDVYTGSGGRSGGERQKLVTFCLAAALRFQLAPEGHTDPTYALVVIDEAFDKADHTFTQAGLEVFRTFGFQLLLATPMKMLQTIDDYVGGVVMVTNQPGRGSTLQELHYDLARPASTPAAEAEQETLV